MKKKLVEKIMVLDTKETGQLVTISLLRYGAPHPINARLPTRHLSLPRSPHRPFLSHLIFLCFISPIGSPLCHYLSLPWPSAIHLRLILSSWSFLITLASPHPSTHLPVISVSRASPFFYPFISPSAQPPLPSPSPIQLPFIPASIASPILSGSHALLIADSSPYHLSLPCIPHFRFISPSSQPPVPFPSPINISVIRPIPSPPIFTPLFLKLVTRR